MNRAEAATVALCEQDVAAMPSRVERLRRAVEFKAWKVGAGTLTGQAYPLDTGGAETLDEAMQIAATGCNHHDGLFVLRIDHAARSHRLRVCQIKRETKRQYRRNPVTGEGEWQQRLYPVRLFEVEVAPGGFDPKRAFDALRDDAVGVDRTLVEQG